MRSPLAPNDSRHGSENGYTNYGCRCEECRFGKAFGEFSRQRMRSGLEPLTRDDYRARRQAEDSEIDFQTNLDGFSAWLKSLNYDDAYLVIHHE